MLIAAPAPIIIIILFLTKYPYHEFNTITLITITQITITLIIITLITITLITIT